MKIEIHIAGNSQVAELTSDNILIKNAADGTDLVGTLYFQGFGKIILHKENISDDFFDLKTGLAGELFQKFSNYRLRVAIVGDFSQYSPGRSMGDFISESNRKGHIIFVNSLEEALQKL